MSVVPFSLASHSRPRPRLPDRPASEASYPVREETIASETDVRGGLVPHLGRLWRYAFVLARARDVADDLVQQTCVRALERAAQFSGPNIDHWLFAILHSIWLNELRSRLVRQGQGTVEAGEVLSFDGGIEADRRLLANQVMRLVDALPEAQRSAVFLAYVEGMAYREVAAILDIPIGTVMSRLAAARAKLAEATSEVVR